VEFRVAEKEEELQIISEIGIMSSNFVVEKLKRIQKDIAGIMVACNDYKARLAVLEAANTETRIEIEKFEQEKERKTNEEQMKMKLLSDANILFNLIGEFYDSFIESILEPLNTAHVSLLYVSLLY
jgi:cell division protein FtsB